MLRCAGQVTQQPDVLVGTPSATLAFVSATARASFLCDLASAGGLRLMGELGMVSRQSPVPATPAPAAAAQAGSVDWRLLALRAGPRRTRLLMAAHAIPIYMLRQPAFLLPTS